MQEIILWLLDNLNYWTVTIFMAIESSFIPFPSEVVVPPAAWLTGSSDVMSFAGVVIFATLGADIGALINYYLAKKLGRPVVYKFARSRWGRYCLIDEAKVMYAEEYFVKNGAISTLIGRLVPAVRQLISIPAGLAGMHLGKFLFFTTLGAGVWNTVLAAIGYAIYKMFPVIDTPQKVADKAAEYSHIIGYGILAIVLIGLLVLVVKKMRKKA